MAESIARLIAALADWLPLGYAFGAGMVSTVNPCGILLLPSYIAYYLGTGEENRHSPPVLGLQGLLLSVAITLGFVVLFATIGLAVSLSGSVLLRFFPVGGLAIGVALAGLGLWLLWRGGSIGIAAAGRVGVTFHRNLRNAFVFGIAYGVASLSCTLPIFLVVVGSALALRGMAQSLLQFVGYSLGMGFVVAWVIVGTVIFKGMVTSYLRRVVPYVHRISAVFLAGAGLYLIYYWLKSGAVF